MSAEGLTGTSISVSGGFEVAGLTDTGRVRHENQDGWLAFATTHAPGCVLIVTDGIGGSADGAIAARVAREGAATVLRTPQSPAEHLAAATVAADESVGRHRKEINDAMCGTTLVLAAVTPHLVTVANVGDSRAYLIRGGTAMQVTVDHSWVAEEVLAGRLAPGADRHHPRRNIITRALVGEGASADLFTLVPQPRDILMLCSDGVWEALEDPLIADLLSQPKTASELAVDLVEAALDAGSNDNVTALLCRMPEVLNRSEQPTVGRRTLQAEDSERTALYPSP